MLFAMVQPMPSSSSSNNSLKLIRFDPNQLIHFLVAPNFKAFSRQFERARRSPQKHISVVLEHKRGQIIQSVKKKKKKKKHTDNAPRSISLISSSVM
jgi:hypothetical protein